MWSRRSSREGLLLRSTSIGITVLFLVFAAGCGDPQADESLSEAAESTMDGEALPAVVDSLISDEGERSVAQKVRDASISAAVQLALVDDRDLRAFDLEPVSVNGRVVLQGEVETSAQSQRAESVAAAVDGVRDVINRITSTQEPSIAEARPIADERGRPEADDSAGAQPDDASPSASPQTDAEDDTAATYHTVSYGDNLWDISRAYGVSVDQLTRLNDLGSSAIKPGQRLRIK